MNKSIIEIDNVYKSFGDTLALQGLSLKVEQGKILGLLGPNGAGKTTLIRLLATLLKPDSGSVYVDGLDVVKESQAVRQRIGLAGQYAAIDEILTGRQNLEMVGRLFHLDSAEVKQRAQEVLKEMGLKDAAERSVKTYSGGMRRRLDLGASLMFTPKVLFLDEPTTGLDTKTRRDLWVKIREMVDKGVTLLLTTQYLEEADELADRIVLIDEGKSIAEGTSTELKRKLRGDLLVLELAKKADLTKSASLLEQMYKTKAEIHDSLHQVSILAKNGTKDLIKALKVMELNNIPVRHVNLNQPSLDEVFLELIDKKGTD